MNNKNIIKNYEQVCSLLRNDKTEETKQRFLIIFKELDIQLTKEFKAKLESLSETAPTIKMEVARIEEILSAIKERKNLQERMLEDYIHYLGYKPVDMEIIPELEDEADYIAYRANLIVANEIISDLIKSGKRVNSLKANLAKKKNKDGLEAEIDSIQKDRAEKLETLKSNEAVLNDLYEYCLTAPFNEENAYIEYILIKINPRGTLKIDLSKTKRNIKKRNEEKKTPLEEMPMTTMIGSVRPNNMLKVMEETVAAFDDINVPTNGLIGTTEKIEVDIKDKNEED